MDAASVVKGAASVDMVYREPPRRARWWTHKPPTSASPHHTANRRDSRLVVSRGLPTGGDSHRRYARPFVDGRYGSDLRLRHLAWFGWLPCDRASPPSGAIDELFATASARRSLLVDGRDYVRVRRSIAPRCCG